MEQTLENLEKLASAAPTDWELASRLATARRLQAELSDAMGRPGAAATALQAVELGEAVLAQGGLTDEVIGGTAHALLFAGRLAAQTNDRDSALRHWRHALELLEARLAASKNWRLLDPAARVFAALNNETQKRLIIDRLHRMGYRPLEPWP
jgi:hypothetical protein